MRVERLGNARWFRFLIDCKGGQAYSVSVRGFLPSRSSTMKRAVVFILPIVFSTLLSAQSTGFATSGSEPLGNVQQQPSTFVINLPGSSCPVGMRALQGSGGGLVAVHGTQPQQGPTQRIHLILNNPKAGRVVSARITVRGLSAKSRTVETLANQGSPSDMTRSLEARFSPDSADSVATDLLLAGFTAVNSIELRSVTYADGSTWTVAAEQACRVTPSPMMLVSGR